MVRRRNKDIHTGCYIYNEHYINGWINAFVPFTSGMNDENDYCFNNTVTQIDVFLGRFCVFFLREKAVLVFSFFGKKVCLFLKKGLSFL